MVKTNKLKKRLEEIKVNLNKVTLEKIEALLNTQGVPTWVIIQGSSVPSTNLADRLYWYLCRRKPVKPFEINKEDSDWANEIYFNKIKKNSCKRKKSG
jgi:hypothetical protein